MQSVFKGYNIHLTACHNETTVMNTKTNGLINRNLSVDCRILRIVEFDKKILD